MDTIIFLTFEKFTLQLFMIKLNDIGRVYKRLYVIVE